MAANGCKSGEPGLAGASTKGFATHDGLRDYAGFGERRFWFTNWADLVMLKWFIDGVEGTEGILSH